MAGYDDGRGMGTVHVADKYVSPPGKKFFTWGRAEHGGVWQKNLTDEDGGVPRNHDLLLFRQPAGFCVPAAV